MTLKKLSLLFLYFGYVGILTSCCEGEDRDNNAVYLQLIKNTSAVSADTLGYTTFKVLEEGNGDNTHDLFTGTEYLDINIFGPQASRLLVLPIYPNHPVNTFVLLNPQKGNDTLVINGFNARAEKTKNGCGFQMELQEPKIAGHSFDSIIPQKFNADQNYLLVNAYYH